MATDKAEMMGPVASKADAPECVSYPSMPGAEEIELPILDAPNHAQKVTKVRVDQLPNYVDAVVQGALDEGDDAPAALQWVLGAMRGAALVDEATSKRLDGLARQFEAAPDQEEFFHRILRPYLYGLRPGPRPPR